MISSERVCGVTVPMALEDAMRPGGQRNVALVLRFSPELSPRRARAALWMLAAQVELASPPAEAWSVHTDLDKTHVGRVRIALAGWDDAEAWRATAVLRRVAPLAK